MERRTETAPDRDRLAELFEQLRADGWEIESIESPPGGKGPFRIVAKRPAPLVN